MPKARLRVVFVVEYEIDRSNYPDGSILADCLNIDIEGIKGDPFLLLEDVEPVITGEILSDEAST